MTDPFAPPQLSPAEARHNEPEQTRENILDVAAREFADKGLDGARIDEIAEKTNSSKRMTELSLPRAPAKDKEARSR